MMLAEKNIDLIKQISSAGIHYFFRWFCFGALNVSFYSGVRGQGHKKSLALQMLETLM